MTSSLEVHFQLKNSKCFSAEEWLNDSFLSGTQLNTCRTIFPGEAAQLALSVVDLTRLSAELLARGPSLTSYYLDQAERERLASFKFAKRHTEWLGGRIAAKNAAMALLGTTPHPPPHYTDLRIETDASGRPYLPPVAGTSSRLPEISISHSGNFAGGLAVRGRPCGLDLQRITPKVIKVRDRIASNAEVDLICVKLPLYAESTALSLLWSAKESFRKAIACQPLIGFTELTLRSLTGDILGGMIGHFSCPRLASSLLPALLTIRGDFACAITVIGEPRKTL